jgi:hypothetical protein
VGGAAAATPRRLRPAERAEEALSYLPLKKGSGW